MEPEAVLLLRPPAAEAMVDETSSRFDAERREGRMLPLLLFHPPLLPPSRRRTAVVAGVVALGDRGSELAGNSEERVRADAVSR